MASALSCAQAQAAESPQGAAPPAAAGNAQGERVNIDAVKRNYWSRNEENETRVVQNRLYSKSLKFELGAYVGTISTDPFLSVKNLGASVGFHINEYWGVNLLLWKYFTEKSSALEFLEQSRSITTNNNYPESFKGGEVAWSPIYGKLSVLGQLIIHYDLHVMGGVGLTGTESGNYFTASLGVGQQIYLNKFSAIRLDYRLMRFNEGVKQKDPAAPNFNQIDATRTNYSDVITLGVSFFLDPLH